ncbi:MAG: hypothetical protein JMDDDDMK_03936 [Acidobacteria bacterium]|nr:hypothetical protein [Acidobacteriota bacterium]
MLRLLIDQDFDQDILRGLRLRVPTLDAVTAYEIGMSAAPDPELLKWAADNGRILLTHDRQTMPDHVADRITSGQSVAGVVIVSRRLPISRVIDDLEIIVICSKEDEWENVVRHLPL